MDLPKAIHEPMSADLAMRELLAGRPLVRKSVEGPLDFNKHGIELNQQMPITIKSCVISCLSAVNLTTDSLMTFEDTEFGEFQLLGCFYFHGLTIERCSFKGPVNLLWGGHNKHGPVSMTNSVFHEFVDFEDSWFMGPFLLENVTFNKGTNLLGMAGEPYRVTFDQQPVLKNVQGELHLGQHFTGNKS